MLGIVVSRPDPASRAIGTALRDIAAWETTEDTSRPDAAGGGTVWRMPNATIREFDDRHLDLVKPAVAFEDPTLLAFASKHAGDTGPLLTAHHTGNLGPADHGGEPNSLARACPAAHATVLGSLRDYAPAAYDVGMEATHHGPTEVGAPSMFVEIGSDEAQWRDRAAAEAVARAILDLRTVSPDRPLETHPTGDRRRHLVGFGGGHYAHRFDRLVTETDWAVGHVAPKWGLEALGDPSAESDVVDALFSASRATYAVVDGDLPQVEDVVRDLGHEVVSETWVREVDGVPFPTVELVENRVTSIADGLRFGHRGAGYTGPITVEPLPDALLQTVNGIDQATTRSAIAAVTVAFVTAQEGSLAVGPVVLPAGESRDPLIEALMDVLERRYDSVERQNGSIIARERVFDPELAREQGVSEGPAFGQLANGEAITVDGEEVDPEDVRSERVDEFSVDPAN